MPTTCCEVTVTPVEKGEPKIQWKGGERERKTQTRCIVSTSLDSPNDNKNQ